MNQLQERIYSNDYADLIIPYNYATPERFLQINAAYSPQIINRDYGMIHVPIQPNSASRPELFHYSLVPNLFLPLDTTSLENTGILKTQNQPALRLKGDGILMGFLDTGILYTHPAFQAPGNLTRIQAIWDQTIPSEDNDGPFGYGTLYQKDAINQALSSPTPLDLVPTTDTNGHGTFVAGAAAGSSDPVADFIGAAPESTLAVVRLKEAKPHLTEFYYFSGEGPVFQETDLMTGIQFLTDLSRELRMPLVICIALGSNQGDHNGFTPLEQSLRQLEVQPGVVTVTAGGNEAGMAHHYSGSVSSSETPDRAEIHVQENTPGFFLEFWGDPPDLFSLGFRSPVGETVAKIPARLGQTEVVRFFLEETRIYIRYELVQNTSGSQLIFVRFDKPTPGIWTIDVYSSGQSKGEFHMWLPVSGFLSPDVTFLSPDPFTTITTPGNTLSAITPAAFNAYNNSLYLHSSRGYTRAGQIKPDFAAPGVDVSGPNLRNDYTIRSGTSAAAALTAGSAALLLEWGMKQQAYQYFFTSQIKNYFIRGADRSPALSYPNREWGYGTLNVYNTFTSISTT